MNTCPISEEADPNVQTSTEELNLDVGCVPNIFVHDHENDDERPDIHFVAVLSCN